MKTTDGLVSGDIYLLLDIYIPSTENIYMSSETDADYPMPNRHPFFRRYEPLDEKVRTFGAKGSYLSKFSLQND